MTRERRHFTPETKVALLWEHLLDKVPVSDICEKSGITVTLFYHWQKQFFENGIAAFTAHDKRRKGVGGARVGVAVLGSEECNEAPGDVLAGIGEQGGDDGQAGRGRRQERAKGEVLGHRRAFRVVARAVA
jgi:transposase-like protein